MGTAEAWAGRHRGPGRGGVEEKGGQMPRHQGKGAGDPPREGLVRPALWTEWQLDFWVPSVSMIGRRKSGHFRVMDCICNPCQVSRGVIAYTRCHDIHILSL